MDLGSVGSGIKWGDLSVLTVLFSIIGYLWRQNTNIKAQQQSEMVNRIEASIDKLSETIKESTTKFEATTTSMWSHIGRLDKRLSNLIGQHEAIHKSHVDE